MAKKFYTLNDYTTHNLDEVELERVKKTGKRVIHETDNISWLSYFNYHFSTGDIMKLPYFIADLFCEINNCKVLKMWRDKVNVRIIGGDNGPVKYTGWNPALGMHIKSYTHYKDEIKRRGLECAGNESLSRLDCHKSQEYITDDVIQEAVSMGAEISGQEAEALKSGKDLS